jgi:hypothetical protein
MNMINIAETYDGIGTQDLHMGLETAYYIEVLRIVSHGCYL